MKHHYIIRYRANGVVCQQTVVTSSMSKALLHIIKQHENNPTANLEFHSSVRKPTSTDPLTGGQTND